MGAWKCRWLDAEALGESLTACGSHVCHHRPDGLCIHASHLRHTRPCLPHTRYVWTQRIVDARFVRPPYPAPHRKTPVELNLRCASFSDPGMRAALAERRIPVRGRVVGRPVLYRKLMTVRSQRCACVLRVLFSPPRLRGVMAANDVRAMSGQIGIRWLTSHCFLRHYRTCSSLTRTCPPRFGGAPIKAWGASCRRPSGLG
jgi:hypothetical protein